METVNMKKFTLPEEKKSLLEPFEVELKGKTFQIDVIDYEFITALENMDENKGGADAVIKALIGEKAYEENKPFSFYEASMCFRWIADEIITPLLKSEDTPKKGSKKSELKNG